VTAEDAAPRLGAAQPYLDWLAAERRAARNTL
jgi:hypothetical protein